MISRREVVTAGMLGTLSNAAMAAPGQAQSNRGDAGMEVNLSEIRGELRDMKGILEDGMRRSSLGFGGIGTIRDRLTLYLRSSGKFPDFCEIGTTLFSTHNLPLQVVGVLILVATIGVVILSRRELK